MGRNLRHVRTLTRKNLINWKRTWFGSLCELFIPILTMSLLCFYKLNEQPEFTAEETLLGYASAQYPVTQQIGINWHMIKKQPDTLRDFLEFTNVTKTDDMENFYQRYATYFYPQQCYDLKPPRDPLGSSPEDLRQEPSKARNMTAIGVVRNRNRVEVEFLDQLKLILTTQYAKSPSIYHNFTFVEFESREFLDFYLEHPDYSISEKRPGLCFAFEIVKYSDQRYELHIFENDQMHIDPDGAGVPRQVFPSVDPIRNSADKESFEKYMHSGFAHIQNWVANTVLQESVGVEGSSISMVTVPTKSAAYNYDAFMFSVLDQFLPLATLLSFFTPVFRLTYRIVAEKETRVRESMTMMGLTQVSYWTSWLIYYMLLNFCISSACTIILANYLLNFSSWLVIWLYFFAFGTSIFGFIIFCQAFWEKARNAAIFTVVFYVSTAALAILVAPADVPKETKQWASLIPTTVAFNLAKPLAGYESVGIGLNFQTAQTLEFQNYVFMEGIQYLGLDLLIYTLIGIYIDNIFPRESGIRKEWTYVCDWLTPTYWDCFQMCRRSDRKSAVEMREEFANNTFKARKGHLFQGDGVEKAPVFDLDFETKYINQKNFEPPDLSELEQERYNKYLKIQDLKKVFPNGQRAVDGVNVRMYEGQIFALLGHNGAGKTTTISMLTGMLRPSEGFATVYGYDVFQYDLDDVRRLAGVCPQHDILFDLLTPWEHLSLFQEFKGVDKSQKKKNEEIEKLLKDVGLWDMRNTVARNLSGGSKRKLSVAIALCGDSKFVMLDEPTAGMDLQARRSLWNMLRAYRTGRIIILTTHYMDEADVLGDRIGIMAQGKLVCLGASLFLKKRYGVGYNLTLEKIKQDDNSVLEPYLKDKLGSEVRKLSEIAREITFQIPIDVAFKFKDFFKEFDRILNKLGVAGYGISITTLEEVFLAVGDGRDFGEHNFEKEKIRKKILAGKGDENSNQGTTQNDEDDNLIDTESDQIKRDLKLKQEIERYSVSEQMSADFITDTQAMVKKRCTLMCRNWLGLLFEIFTPVLFVLIGFIIIQITLLYPSPPRTHMTKLFPLPQHILVNEEPIIRNTFENGTLNYESTAALISQLPSSYTLLSDYDFVVTSRNYTEELLINDLLAKNKGTTSREDPDYFDLFKEFDQDNFDLRNEFSQEDPYRYGSYLIYEMNNRTKNFKVVNYVNSTSQDVAASFPQFMYESILKTASGYDHFSFKLVTHPYPILQKYKDAEQETSVISLLFVVAVGLSLLPGTIVSAVMYERESSLKHMQMISGLNMGSYWLVNVIFDIFKMQIPMILCVILLFVFQLKDYYSSMFIFLAFPFAIVPFTHATSFLFKQEWSAQLFTVGLNLLVMIFGPLTVYVFLFTGTPENVYLGVYINQWLRLIPSYGIVKTLLFCGTRKILLRKMNTIELDFPQDLELDRWTWDNQLGDLIFMGFHFVAGSVAILFFEGIIYQTCWLRCFFFCCSCCFKNDPKETQAEDAFGGPNPSISTLVRREEAKDSDVLAEEVRIERSTKDDMPVRVENLTKVFKLGVNKNLTAVNSASFGLDAGDCFALLGVNGAGKTTTFKSLTNDQVPTSGRISVMGFDVQRQFSRARRMIGYCPQHNTIFEAMTVEENLHFFAKIKGVSRKMESKLVQNAIEQLNLADHRFKEAGQLSGGNKRKLQVAIAIIGNPPIMLLDEPSTGMDPEARRFMWQVVAGLTQTRKKCAVVLTTHSMEEAEALSTKMGIMVKGGVFKCMGSVQHIKNKFGTGYEIEIKIRKPTVDQIMAIATQFSIQIDQMRMSIPEFKQALEYCQYPRMILEEITTGGLGDELLKEAKGHRHGLVRTQHLLEWIFVIEHTLDVIRELALHFGTVEVLSNHNNFFKLRVLRQNKSIGFVFGLIEDKKDQFAISEYSASQTTLEQIFQMFAFMSIESDSLHLVFKYNENAPRKLSLFKTTQMAGPITQNDLEDNNNQIWNMHDGQIEESQAKPPSLLIQSNDKQHKKRQQNQDYANKSNEFKQTPAANQSGEESRKRSRQGSRKRSRERSSRQKVARQGKDRDSADGTLAGGIEMSEVNNNEKSAKNGDYSSLSGLDNGTQQRLNVQPDAIQMSQPEQFQD